MPRPRQNGSASAILVPVAYRLLEKSTTWITTGATHAPASSAAIAPIENAITNVPVPAPGEKREPKLEKSIISTSNIARPSTMKMAAMTRLNQGEALIVPNVPAVRMTTRPRTPYTMAIAPPYAAPSRNPRPRDDDPSPARFCVPAPMIARLIGIIGRTHGVRFSARPPMRTSSRIASGPRPSNMPRSFTPVSALWMNVRKSVVPRYPPVVPRTVNSASARSSSLPPAAVTSPGVVACVSRTLLLSPPGGFSPLPNLIDANVFA